MSEEVEAREFMNLILKLVVLGLGCYFLYSGATEEPMDVGAWVLIAAGFVMIFFATAPSLWLGRAGQR